MSALITMLLLSPTLFTQVEGKNEPLTVILTYPDVEYHIGDEVTARAHIFRGGVRIDPDVVVFTAGKEYDRYPMSRSAKGLWEGTVQITKDRIYHYDYFPIEISITVDTPEHEWDFDGRLVYVSNLPHLHVNMYIDDDEDQLPSPGDPVDFTVTVSHGDRFVDPDPGTLRVWVAKGDHANTEDLTVVRRSAGVYDGTYVLPSDIQQDMFFSLRVEANYTGDIDTESMNWDADMYLRRYTTWVQHVEADGTKANVEIHVVDHEGAPVANAPIALYVSYRNADGEYVDTSVNLTTGPNGMAPLQFQIEDVDPHFRGPFVIGNITVNGYVQRLAFWVPNPDYVGRAERRSSGFRVNLQNDQPIPAGTNVSLRFNATYNGTPLADMEVDSYLYWDHSVLFHGTMTTDDGGEFVIDIDTPNAVHEGWWRDEFEGQFKAVTHAGLNCTWRTYEFSYYASSSDYQTWRHSDATLDLVQIGEGTYQFFLRSPGMDGEGEYVRFEWGLGARYESPMTFPRWSSGDYYFSPGHPLEAEWSGDAWVGTVDLPSMIPGDTTFNLEATFVNIDEPHSEWIRVRILNSTEHLNNEPPTLEIREPGPGETVEGRFRIKGTASDDMAVTLVEVRIDGGTWTAVAGTDDWEFEVMADELEEGLHEVEAWSFDGTKRSEIDTVEFHYIRVEHSADDPVPILIIIVVLIIMAVSMILVLKTRFAK